MCPKQMTVDVYGFLILAVYFFLLSKDSVCMCMCVRERVCLDLHEYSCNNGEKRPFNQEL